MIWLHSFMCKDLGGTLVQKKLRCEHLGEMFGAQKKASFNHLDAIQIREIQVLYLNRNTKNLRYIQFCVSIAMNSRTKLFQKIKFGNFYKEACIILSFKLIQHKTFELFKLLKENLESKQKILRFTISNFLAIIQKSYWC